MSTTNDSQASAVEPSDSTLMLLIKNLLVRLDVDDTIGAKSDFLEELEDAGRLKDGDLLVGLLDYSIEEKLKSEGRLVRQPVSNDDVYESEASDDDDENDVQRDEALTYLDSRQAKAVHKACMQLLEDLRGRGNYWPLLPISFSIDGMDLLLWYTVRHRDARGRLIMYHLGMAYPGSNRSTAPSNKDACLVRDSYGKGFIRSVEGSDKQNYFVRVVKPVAGLKVQSCMFDESAKAKTSVTHCLDQKYYVFQKDDSGQLVLEQITMEDWRSI